MSDLPGAMTKPILSAPPRTIRSIRYSLTARGRSTPSSRRLPTGSSSLEKASGWMRVPPPAAGTIPHISRLRHRRGAARTRPRGRRQRPFQLGGATIRGVLVMGTLACRGGDATKLGLVGLHSRQGVVGRTRNQDLAARLVENLDPLPSVAEDGTAARCRLEQPP